MTTEKPRTHAMDISDAATLIGNASAMLSLALYTATETEALLLVPLIRKLEAVREVATALAGAMRTDGKVTP